jgi:hypothetical protein
MSSKNYGTSISHCEVTDINKNGIRMIIEEKEYFLSFADFPMFKDLPVEKIFKVDYHPPAHLRWEEFDIDIELDSLENLENYPLLFHS